MPSTVLHSPQEISALYGQLPEDKKQRVYQFLRELLSLPDTKQPDEVSSPKGQTIYDYFKNANAAVADMAKGQTIYDLCKDCDPKLGDIELELTPRKEQLSRKDVDFE